jgi:hypothetical protein
MPTIMVFGFDVSSGGADGADSGAMVPDVAVVMVGLFTSYIST